MTDMERVNHPDYYQGKYECIELMRAVFGDSAVADFCRCNAFKYRFRAGKKDGVSAAEDLAKADFYDDYLMHIVFPGRFSKAMSMDGEVEVYSGEA